MRRKTRVKSPARELLLNLSTFIGTNSSPRGLLWLDAILYARLVQPPKRAPGGNTPNSCSQGQLKRLSRNNRKPRNSRPCTYGIGPVGRKLTTTPVVYQVPASIQLGYYGSRLAFPRDHLYAYFVRIQYLTYIQHL